MNTILPTVVLVAMLSVIPHSSSCAVFDKPQRIPASELYPAQNLLSAPSADAIAKICPNCSNEENHALATALQTHTSRRSANGWIADGSGFLVNNTCSEYMGSAEKSFTTLLRNALAQGLVCLGAQQTNSARILIKELAAVFAIRKGAAVAIACNPLEAENMRGVSYRSPDGTKIPKIILNAALAARSEQEIRSVIFHELLHLGGDGHVHGTSVERVTTCQFCCFDSTPYTYVNRDDSCALCNNDYPDNNDLAYLADMERWSTRTPGQEFLYRVSLADTIKVADGTYSPLLRLLKAYKDHPFGFELARKLYEMRAWSGEDRRLIRSVRRKQHGHVTRHFIPLAQQLSDAFLLRATSKIPSEQTMHELSILLGSSRLPERAAIAKLDMPYFNKYFYEFALLRSVLSAELHTYWQNRLTATCGDETDASLCVELEKERKRFHCQKNGLDMNSTTGVCE